jgi:peptidoglycan hydrolase CwlO-like protein
MGLTVEQAAIRDDARTKIKIFRSRIADLQKQIDGLECRITEEEKKLKQKLRIKKVSK